MKHLKFFFFSRLPLRAKKQRSKARTGFLPGIMSLLLLASLLLTGRQGLAADRNSTASPDTTSNLAVPPFRVASWDPDSGLGNHRAVVTVRQKADAVFVRIPWRRPDPSPEKKRVLVLAGKEHQEVKNVFPLNVNNEYGDFLFQAPEAPAEYYFYYLPYKLEEKTTPKLLTCQPITRPNQAGCCAMALIKSALLLTPMLSPGPKWWLWKAWMNSAVFTPWKS